MTIFKYVMCFLIAVLVTFPCGSEEVTEYVIGPDDVLEIFVWGYSDLSRMVVVRPDGKISIPLLDDIEASGLTPSQLDKEITALLSKYIPNPQVTVIIHEFKSKKIYIIGEVKKPGVVVLTKTTTFLEAISIAGGLTEKATLEKAYVARGTKILPVDLHLLLKEGDLANNILLMPGDVVFIPDNTEEVVYVLGEVNKPGQYPIRGKFTLLDAVSTAGGHKPTGLIKHTTVVRGGLKSPKIFTVNLEGLITHRKGEDILLEPGDIVYIPKTLFAKIDAVISKVLLSLQIIMLGIQVFK